MSITAQVYTLQQLKRLIVLYKGMLT